MTEYVLEILDGDRAGELIALGSQTVTIGRRQGNTVVLHDEKVSGQHASISNEGGQWVLKDLGSTNGTLMEGRRIDEVGLTENDIVQLGRIRVAFKRTGAPTPEAAGGGLAVRQVDSALLAKTRKRGGGLLWGLVAAVLLLGGGAAWLLLGNGKAGGGAGGSGRPRAVLVVTGNTLKNGGMETGPDAAEGDGDGWNLAVSGAGFVQETGARGSNTGRGYLSARGDADGKVHHAVARCRERVVSAPGGLALQAWARTKSGGKASLRVRFWTSDPSRGGTVITGTTPAVADSYTKLEFSIGVPKGCDRAAVELVALLPSAEASVSFDDVAMVEQTNLPSHEAKSSSGLRLVGAGSAVFLVDGASQPVLYRVTPIVTDAGLLELDKAALLCCSDAGVGLKCADKDPFFLLSFENAGSGVHLWFDPSVVAAGVLASRNGEPFVAHGASFTLEGVDRLLLGRESSRLMIELPRELRAKLRGEVVGDLFRLTLPALPELRISHTFAEQREKARVLLEQAQEQSSAGNYHAVLDRVQEALQKYPHDDRQAAKLTALRNEVRGKLEAKLRYLRGELDELIFLPSLAGYRRLDADLGRTVTTYGEAYLTEPEKFAAMRKRVRDTIHEMEAEANGAVRARLLILKRALAGSGSKDDAELVTMIDAYAKEYLPGGEKPAAKGEGK
ncbi:MAG: FHA domain-containing protein [Planctomycetes bacterium]|nr:FHA domain-containing protein [Planctomycetota bacterium]MCB9889233.1 FHA domain-containing protein [Planctomycetota bacterium]